MDELILVASPKAKKTASLEKDSLKEVLIALRTHSKVAFIERLNSGVAKIGGRFVRFGWVGAPDLIGFTKDGRLIACEVKKQGGGKLSTEQAFFLAMVKQHGGVAFVARNLNDVLNALKGE